MVNKKRERREEYKERSSVERRIGRDPRKKPVLIDFPDRRIGGDRRKDERRKAEDRRASSGPGDGDGKGDGSKRARPPTYRDSKGDGPDREPRRRTYRDT
jgi:hypothetical protein